MNADGYVHRVYPAAVYMMQRADGLIKIGYAMDPVSRRSGVQGDVEMPVRLLCLRWTPESSSAKRLERWLHRKFSAYRVTGEWFRPAAEILALAKSRFCAVRNGARQGGRKVTSGAWYPLRVSTRLATAASKVAAGRGWSTKQLIETAIRRELRRAL